MWRIIGAAILIVGGWMLTYYGQSRPVARGKDAAQGQFSAARAEQTLARLLGPQLPHPTGSQQSAVFRARLLRELQALGLNARTQTRFSCRSPRRATILACATVTNVIANVEPGRGKEVLLMAHTDSVPAGPGAADDGSGVAMLLETIRAMHARHFSAKHPITALFTDGEEVDLLGASAYLKDRTDRDEIGVVINLEARGNQGPSFLFQTSAGNSKLIDLYAASVKEFATSSLYPEIYKYLPNDTDLTPMLAAHIPGYNFSFIGNVAEYHTARDRLENLDPRSIQQQGQDALGLAMTLSGADLSTLRAKDAIYLDIVGRWLPRLPQSWALPFSILVLILFVVAAWLSARKYRLSDILAGLAVVPLFVGCSVLLGFLLYAIASQVSGNNDPALAHPLLLRLALGLGTFGLAVIAARKASGIAIWLWFGLLSLLAAAFAPGLSPYFLFPCLVAAPLILATLYKGGEIGLFASALLAVLIWTGLAASGEAIMGLKLHPLITIALGFALLPLLPLLAKARAQARKVVAMLSLILALVLSIAQGFESAYSMAAPERLNIRYLEYNGKAWWIADPVQHLPTSLRAAAQFSAKPETELVRGYVAPAGPARFAPPAAQISRRGADTIVALDTTGDGVVILAPSRAQLESIAIGSGGEFPIPDPKQVICASPDCGHARLKLRISASSPITLTIIVQRRGLPLKGRKLLQARPAYAAPSQSGDQTLLASDVTIP